VSKHRHPRPKKRQKPPFLEKPPVWPKKVAWTSSGIACGWQKSSAETLLRLPPQTSDRSRRLVPAALALAWSSPLQWCDSTQARRRGLGQPGCIPSRFKQTPQAEKVTTGRSRPVLDVDQAAAASNCIRLGIEIALHGRLTDPIVIAAAPESTICPIGGERVEPAAPPGTGVAEPKA